jgi:hypothetical protein
MRRRCAACCRVLSSPVVECRDLAASDPNGYSDPYVVLALRTGGGGGGGGDSAASSLSPSSSSSSSSSSSKSKHKHHSAAIPKTLNPVFNWDGEVPLDAESVANGEIVLEVFDKDQFTRNDFLGCARIAVGDVWQADAGHHGGWYALYDKKFEKRTSGRVYVAFAAHSGVKSRSQHEQQSLLYWSTMRIESDAQAATLIPPRVATPSPSSSSSVASVTESASELTLASPASSSASPPPAEVTSYVAAAIAGTAPTAERLSMFVGSWNAGNAPPPASLERWLMQAGAHSYYDVYNIGVQECNYVVGCGKSADGGDGAAVSGGAAAALASASASGIKKLQDLASDCGTHFGDTLQRALGDEYVLVKRHDMMEIRNYLCIHANEAYIANSASGHDRFAISSVTTGEFIRANGSHGNS